MFPIGSTQVTCTATNEVGNTGMTSFMVTINPIPQTTDQSLSVKVGKDLYNNFGATICNWLCWKNNGGFN